MYNTNRWCSLLIDKPRSKGNSYIWGSVQCTNLCVFIITDKVKTGRGGGKRCRCYEENRTLLHTMWINWHFFCLGFLEYFHVCFLFLVKGRFWVKGQKNGYQKRTQSVSHQPVNFSETKWWLVCARWTPEVTRKRSVSRWVCKIKRHTNSLCRHPDRDVLGISDIKSIVWEGRWL